MANKLSMTDNTAIDYDDRRFQQVETDKNQALSELNNTYDKMINQSDQYYQKQIDATKDWQQKQTQLQQEQTDFAIQQIEQQKDQAKKDYTREQSGAYVDWQKQSNQYGANAEQMATNGLTNTGYSESSQVSMYNTYQNRVATARESYNQIVQNYNNSITQARLQNNSVLAEIAYQSLQQQLELSLQGFQYKNQLVLDKATKKTELDNTYYNRYKDVLSQINTENALTEEIRQYNKNRQLEIDKHNESIRQFNVEIARLKAQDKKDNKMEIEKLELQKKQLEEEKRQFNANNKSSGGSDDDSNDSKIDKPNNTITTEYYSGEKNADCQEFGTFANGYQPKGISGHGKLSKTGDTIDVSTKTLSGKKQILIQNIWKAKDGTKWYWDGSKNKYIQIK